MVISERTRRRRLILGLAGVATLALALAVWGLWPRPTLEGLSPATIAVTEHMGPAGEPQVAFDIVLDGRGSDVLVLSAEREAGRILRGIMEHWPRRFERIRLRVRRRPGGAAPPPLVLDFETAVLRRLDLERLPGPLLNLAAPKLAGAGRNAVANFCLSPERAPAYRSFCIRALQ